MHSGSGGYNGPGCQSQRQWPTVRLSDFGFPIRSQAMGIPTSPLSLNACNVPDYSTGKISRSANPLPMASQPGQLESAERKYRVRARNSYVPLHDTSPTSVCACALHVPLVSPAQKHRMTWLVFPARGKVFDLGDGTVQL